jgi:SAM-dependent methyltransferase
MDAAAWDRRYTDTDLVWSAEPNRFVAAELADLPPGRALDLAAGEGRNALWLAGRGWRVTAVDFSAVAIHKGRRIAARAGVEIDWVVADVLTYRPDDEHDLVVVAYLHLPPPSMAGVWATAVRALAPGGVLLVVGHDRTNITDGTGGPQDATLLHDPDDVAAHLDGLVVDRAERVRREVGDRAAIDTLVRAHRPGTAGP